MTSQTLDRAPAGRALRVLALEPSASAPDWTARLAELGFVAGEQVQLLRRGPIGGDPVVVRVGASTFALRLAEAACVRAALSA
jgi:ferrous iron transport protein A